MHVYVSAMRAHRLEHSALLDRSLACIHTHTYKQSRTLGEALDDVLEVDPLHLAGLGTGAPLPLGPPAALVVAAGRVHRRCCFLCLVCWGGIMVSKAGGRVCLGLLLLFFLLVSHASCKGSSVRESLDSVPLASHTLSLCCSLSMLGHNYFSTTTQTHKHTNGTLFWLLLTAAAASPCCCSTLLLLLWPSP